MTEKDISAASATMKKIVSSVQESKLVAILQEEKKSGEKGNRRLLVLVGFLSVLLVTLHTLAWYLKQDKGMPAKQEKLGEEEVNDRKSSEEESRDLTLEKSTWMMTFDKIQMTFDKIRSEVEASILVISRWV